MAASAPTFYFSAMSPYSWLAAERIDGLLPDVIWRPVAGAVIHAQRGRISWGLTASRSLHIAECERRAAERGLGPIRWPNTWPSDGTCAARALTFADGKGMLRPLALATMRAGFLEGRDIADRQVITDAGAQVGLDVAELLCAIDSAVVEQALNATIAEAIAAGMMGMPTVVIDGDTFWGDDRLEAAAARARGGGPPLHRA